MRAIIYNNIEQAETLKLRLKNRVKDLFKGNTTEYTYIKEHPTDGRAAVIIDENGVFWDEIYDELNPNDINNIETLTSDWYPVIDI